MDKLLHYGSESEDDTNHKDNTGTSFFNLEDDLSSSEETINVLKGIESKRQKPKMKNEVEVDDSSKSTLQPWDNPEAIWDDTGASFFNLDDDSSSSEETSNVHEGIESKRQKPEIKNKEEVDDRFWSSKSSLEPWDNPEAIWDNTGTSFFNLDDDSSSSEETNNVHKGIESKKQKPEIKNKEEVDDRFWGSKSTLEPWDNPEAIWGTNEKSVCNIAVANESHVSKRSNHKLKTLASCSNEHGNKKPKLLSFHQQSNEMGSKQLIMDSNKQKSCNASEKKSLFYVHHKISPFLDVKTQDNRSSKYPRNCKIKLPGHNGAVNKVEWCVSQYSHLLLSASMDKQVKIWNVFSKVNTCVAVITSHTKAVKDACWSGDAKQILSGGYDKTAVVTDVHTGKLISRCEHDGFVFAVKYHPVNYNYFVSGCTNSLVCWDVRNTTRPVRKFTHDHHFGQVNDIAFTADGKQFFSCNDLVSRSSADCNIMAWDFQTGGVLSNQIFQERYTCTKLKMHPIEKEFLAQTQGNYIAAFSTIRPYKLNKYKRYEGHKVVGYNVGCDCSTDGKMVASGSSDGRVLIYDYHYTRKLHEINLGRSTVCLDVAWHPVLASTVAVSTWGGDIHVLD